MRRFLEWLFPPAEGRIFEIRVLKVRPDYGAPYQAVGYFDRADLAAKEVMRFDKQDCGGIYVTLNPADRDCFARAPSKIERAEKATTNADIDCRLWLIIDFDPDRPLAPRPQTSNFKRR